MLDGPDEGLKDANCPARRRTRPRRTRVGWRPVAAQALCVLAVTACVVSLLCHGSNT